MTNDWNLEDTRQPPDEPEAVFCEECGQEVLEEYAPLGGNRSYYAVCENPFCPENFTGVAKEMAERLVEALDTVSKLKDTVRRQNQLIRCYDPGYK